MSSTDICPRCGNPLALDGLTCARCELSLALEPPLPFPSQHSTPTAVKRFGDYELLEEIGHGGMGVVYKARQLSLDRLVALKLLLLGPFSSDQAIQRLRREARAAAALRHPHIVGLLEIGEAEGQHYLTMELVEGRSLAAVLREGPLPPRVAAGHARAIAQAMAAAHAAGILHRDLKPSNILIDPFDQPRITDFGLAKRFVADPSSSVEASDRSTTAPADLTLTDQMLGSPNYLAPEVAAGPRSGVGPAADLFAIGAILYECQTGRPPFLAASLQETLLRIRDTDPVAPRLLDPKLPRDLETICLKCLEKEPSKRYPTAQALADDLERFLNDEPILARPITRVERAWRWCRRKPALASAYALLLLLLLLLSMASPIAAFRINEARRAPDGIRVLGSKA